MNKKKKGFTIVELVVVIAVIGILSAILIPTFAGLIERSKKQGQQLELRNAYEAYAIEAEDKVLTEKEVALGDAPTVVEQTTTLPAKVWILNGEGAWVETAVGTATTNQYKIEEITGFTTKYNGYRVYKLVDNPDYVPANPGEHD